MNEPQTKAEILAAIAENERKIEQNNIKLIEIQSRIIAKQQEIINSLLANVNA